MVMNLKDVFYYVFKIGQEEFDAITKAYYRGMKSLVSVNRFQI